MFKTTLLLFTLIFVYTSIEAQTTLGCTDADAMNYNILAEENNGSCFYEGECDQNFIQISHDYITSMPDLYMPYEILDSEGNVVETGAMNGTAGYNYACLEDGCYTLVLSDIPTGWSGFMDIQVNEPEYWEASNHSTISGQDSSTFSTYIYVNDYSCNENTVEGCTHYLAINYNPDAEIYDGSCIYDEDCEGNEPVITYFNGSWNIIDEDGLVVVQGYTSSGGIIDHLCIPDGCYTLEISAFNNNYNCNFELYLADQLLASSNSVSVSGDSFEFQINSPDCEEQIEGCTDPEAVNYDQNATVDDGSCTYPDCEAYTSLLIVHAADDTLHWEVANSDSILFEGLSVNGGGVTQLCLPDDCYNLTITDLSDFGFDGSYAVHIYQPGAVNLLEQFYNGDLVDLDFGINTDCTEVGGCTDAEAINYNPEATIDDGSCIYEPECFIDFDLLADSTNLNTIFVIPADSIDSAVGVLWDFGDGTTSTDLFPFHEYEGDGPYNLCLTVYFETGETDTCEVTFCMEFSADMIPDLFPGTVGSAGFFINIIEDASSIGIGEIQTLSFEVYPNPTTGKINIKLDQTNSADASIEIYDLRGKLLRSQKINDSSDSLINLDISDLSNGIYIVTLRSNKFSQHKKVVKE